MRRKPKEFSKKIFIGVAVVNIVLIAFALYMMYVRLFDNNSWTAWTQK